MALHLRRPTGAELRDLLERCRHDDLTYQPIGGSLGGPVPAGLSHRRWSTNLVAPHAFDRAVDALKQWEMHRAAGLAVATDGEISVGTNVALAAPLPVGWVDATCRIVAVVDDQDRYGFAYGTLSIHPQQGEESFVLSRTDDETATLVVEAVSRPIQPLARLAPPVARHLQARGVHRYLNAMRTAVASRP